MDRQSVFITGISRGLGFALAEGWHSRGFHVFGLVRREDGLRNLSHLGSYFDAVVGDIADEGIEEKIAEFLTARTSSIDILINNAGIAGTGSTLAETKPTEVCSLLDVHCVGALRCARALTPWLRKSPKPIIINVSSRLGSISRVSAGRYSNEAHSYSYRIAKAAQNMATACMHAEFHKEGWIVFALHPGKLATPLSSHSDGIQPAEAAGKVIKLTQLADSTLSGRFIDLETGEDMEW